MGGGGSVGFLDNEDRTTKPKQEPWLEFDFKMNAKVASGVATALSAALAVYSFKSNFEIPDLILPSFAGYGAGYGVARFVEYLRK